jgi:hypothetical protein
MTEAVAWSFPVLLYPAKAVKLMNQPDNFFLYPSIEE